MPPGPGSKLQIRRLRIDPDRIEENLAYFRSVVLPDITSTAGFQAVRQLIDRETGKAAVGTVGADDAALRAADAATQPHRDKAGERGVEFRDVQIREILFMDMR